MIGISAWNLTGLEAANEKRFGDAERFFNIVLSKDHNSASAWSNLGNVHLSLGKAAQALTDFSNAIELASEASALLHAQSSFSTRLRWFARTWSRLNKGLLGQTAKLLGV